MNVQYVSICATSTAEENNCLSLTPELLAATGARYSRNNEGLKSIASKIDHSNLDKSVDAIFKMIDYGHASIADMAPIALFIDDISQFAAYYLWTLSPTAGGQECSTRYLKLDESDLISSEDLNIPKSLRQNFDDFNKLSFHNYKTSLNAWTNISNNNPEMTKIPLSLLNSTSDKDKKIVDRMKRNYAFDRSRVYLPLATKTGVMMIQSARAWANISSHLQSHYLQEFNNLGKEIADKLSIGAPRLLKHSNAKDSLKQYIQEEFNLLKNSVDKNSQLELNKNNEYDNFETLSFLTVDDNGYSNDLIADSCKNRTNRYSPFGNVISRSFVRFSWLGISFGEIRDLNRHRTGNKYCPLVPLGFYSSLDQLPDIKNSDTNTIENCAKSFNNTTAFANDLLKQNIGEYIYFTNLGHQYYFEHCTTADKFLYEMELRTGVGAHYKYAEHCKQILQLWYEKYPETKFLLFEGSAEPE